MTNILTGNMDLITQVVNRRYPINTKCMAKIAKIEGQRAVLKRKITQAMVTDFKVTTLDDKVIDRIKHSIHQDGPICNGDLLSALLVNALTGASVVRGFKYYPTGQLAGNTHYFNKINGVYIDIIGHPYGTFDQVDEIDADATKDMLGKEYTAFVNRYMLNFMEEIK